MSLRKFGSSKGNNKKVFASLKVGFWIWVVAFVSIFSLILAIGKVFAAANLSILSIGSQQGIACPSEVELEVVELLNVERTNQSLPPLIIDMRLMEAAWRHNNDMATNNFFSHTGSDESSPFDRITEAGYSYRSAGENIAAGYSSPAAVVEAWMNSSGHRDNILNSSYQHIGVGYTYNSNATYGHYWTTDFGSTNDAVQPPPPECSSQITPTPTATPLPTTTFMDVPVDHPYYDDIELLYQEGYTAGCSADPLLYCPDRTMNRSESAVYVERGIHGSEYDPPDPSLVVFIDVALDSWYADWVHGLWDDHYTAGCNADPLMYCPDQEHTRAEACVFYLRMMYGPDYEPPSPKGYFQDVDPAMWYAKWVDAAWDAGIAEPCATDPDLLFCPEEPLTRAVAAYMMVRGKGLNSP